MSARRLALLGAVAVVLGCGGEAPRPRPSPAAKPPPATTPAVAPAPAADAAKEPEWSYTSIGRRDPFRSFLATVSTQGLRTRCATPLGRYELDQLRLVAVVTGLEDPVAMVEAPNGVGYSLRRGACVGKNGGTVTAVRSGEVIVSEWVMRADGTRDAAETAIRLPRQENAEEERP